MLADSLLASDRVALEVTGSCWEVARLLEPHVNRVIVVSPDDTGITAARAKPMQLAQLRIAEFGSLLICAGSRGQGRVWVEGVKQRARLVGCGRGGWGGSCARGRPALSRSAAQSISGSAT